MAALPHAQPTIVEVEGSTRPVQRKVAHYDVTASEAEREMARVSIHKSLETQDMNNNAPFHSKVFSMNCLPFFKVFC